MMLNPNDIPLVMTNIAIENGHRNSGFSHDFLVISNSYVNVYQRVSLAISWRSDDVPPLSPQLSMYRRDGGMLVATERGFREKCARAWVF